MAVTVIDLSGSSPENSDDDDDDNDDGLGDTTPPPIPVTVPSISALASDYPTRSELTVHLTTLPRAVLVGMIVDQALPHNDARPGSPTGLAHCVYCHEVFSLEAPYAGNGCRVEHYTECEDSGETVKYDCCGAWMEYYDYDRGCHAPPESELGDYCWEGQHHAAPLKKKHFKRSESDLAELGLDEEYCVGGLGSVKLEDALWWQNWKEYGGETCTTTCGRA